MDITIKSKTELFFTYNDLYYRLVDTGYEYDGHITSAKDVDIYIDCVLQEEMTIGEKDKLIELIVQHIDEDEYEFHEALETYDEMLDMEVSLISKRNEIIFHLEEYIDVFIKQEHYEKINVLKKLIIDVTKELDK